ncbi:MAG: hypothetical protein PHQ98_00385 [Candidatus ainarchaeum sp.]|nr:hypothetical protein [Candidatus ainarchaeum sp.]
MNKIIKIKKSVLNDCFLASQNYYPFEFSCLLSESNGIIDEFVLLMQYNSKNSSSINLFNKPFDSSIIGSFHSHPNSIPYPSTADNKFFKRFKVNIILSLFKNQLNEFDYYFEIYDSFSKKLNYELID